MIDKINTNNTGYISQNVLLPTQKPNSYPETNLLTKKYGNTDVVTISKPDALQVSQETKQKKKLKLSGPARVASVVVGTVIGIGIIIKRKIAADSIKQLASKIEFKPAETIEEAMRFGREHLGIKKYNGFDEGSLDVLNWLNEGLVNTSNKLGGVLRMPSKISYKSREKKNIAHVDALTRNLSINKDFFSNITEEIQKELDIGLENKFLYKSSDGSLSLLHMFSAETERDFRKILKEYQTKKSFRNSMRLYEAISEINNKSFYNVIHPQEYIEDFYKCFDKYKSKFEILEQKKIDDIKKLSIDEQYQYVKRISQVMSQNNVTEFVKEQLRSCQELKAELNANPIILKEGETISSALLTFVLNFKGKIEADFRLGGLNINALKTKLEFRSIYHEMGHVQDDLLRSKSRIATTKYKDASKYPKVLKDWVDNEEYQRIALKVSYYSTMSPGEFVAETFAKMIQGESLSDDIIDLYKKCGGPSVKGYC